MKRSHGLIQLPEEMIIEILCRLPFKTLHKLKCVSKSWLSLITHQVFDKILRTPFMGFFYNANSYRPNSIFSHVEGSNNNNFDPTIAYLPSGYDHHRVVDCCNGLLLCTSDDVVPTHCYVCNLVTRSFDEYPWTFKYHNFVFLDFDPRVSPHYKVVLVSASMRDYIRINIYDSDTKRWRKTRFVTDDRICEFYNPGGNHCCALWKGDVYFDAPWDEHGSMQGDWETVRIGPLDAGDVGMEFIKFPTGTEKPPHHGAYIGKFGDKLCFSGLDGNQLRVWTLRGRQDNEWVMEHIINICDLGCDPKGDPAPRVVGLHPFRTAFLILFKCVVLAYDLKRGSLDEICRVGAGAEAGEDDFSLTSPFFPLSFDLLENRRCNCLYSHRYH